MRKTAMQLEGYATRWAICDEKGRILVIFRRKATALQNVVRYRVGREDLIVKEILWGGRL